MNEPHPPLLSLPVEGPLLDALAALLQPLARLAVANGLPLAAVEEVLKAAMVDAARDAHPGLPPQRSVSRISTTLGLNRREVTRLIRAGEAGAADEAVRGRRPARATELFTRWRTDPSLRDGAGRPRPLPRLGPAPSFEALAQSVTQDVHPRSLLDELCRLGLAALDEATDQVELSDDAFVPRGDAARMLGFLADNVGDHCAAAVSNVMSGGRQHLEQAIFADELSAESLGRLREAIAAQWQQLLGAMVPLLEGLIEADRSAGRTADQRVRIGLFTYAAPMSTATPVGTDTPAPVLPPTPRRRSRTRT